MRWRDVGLVGAVGMISGALLLGCASGVAPANPPPESDVPLAARTIWAGSYSREIQPIFDQYCISCHGPNRAENGLRLDSYQGTIRGTQNGPVVVRGSPGTSTLVSVIQGAADQKIQMPHEGRKLSHNRIENIILWIQAGAPEG